MNPTRQSLEKRLNRLEEQAGTRAGYRDARDMTDAELLDIIEAADVGLHEWHEELKAAWQAAGDASALETLEKLEALTASQTAAERIAKLRGALQWGKGLPV